MPRDTSVTASDIDWLYMFMVWMSVICSVGIFAAMVYFVMKFRATSRKANEVSEPSSEHNTALEIGWSVIPLLICIALFVWGFQGFVNLRTPPKGALEIHVTGQKWKWLFDYPHGTEDVLHVPVDRDVRLILQSVDVLHSFFIPNFRQKMDAVPGRYTDLWFRATEAGEFPVFCAEYCGTAHSDMLTYVKVHEPGGFEKWQAAAAEKILKMPPVELGKLTVEKQGCLVCHTADGTPKIGPTWKGVFGKPEKLIGGTSVTVDENYIRESLIDPAAKIVEGYPPSMPTYAGKLKDAEITGIIEYIKTLK
jgi:cytochrome c oxidase subunit 2